jgi:hypothetical protein
MTDEVGLDAWRQAFAAAAKSRTQPAGRRSRGLAAVTRAGMVRINPHYSPGPCD